LNHATSHNANVARSQEFYEWLFGTPGTHIPRCTRPARPIPLPPDVGAMKPCTPRG